jgi:hypothetical protein
MTAGDGLAVLSLGVVAASWALWARQMQAVEIPENRSPYIVSMAVGATIGLAAFVLGVGLLFGVIAGIAMVAGGLYLALLLQSAQDARRPAVEVGGPMLAFSAPDDAGNLFESVSLSGRPYLLKFFRGHW